MMPKIVLCLLSSLVVMCHPTPARADQANLLPSTHDSQNTSFDPIFIFAPDNVDFTVQKAPTIYFCIAEIASDFIEFTLTDFRFVRPTAEIRLKLSTSSGCHRIRLGDYGIELEPDVQYRWYISVRRDPDSPSTDIVAGAVIERIDPQLGNYCVLSCNKEEIARLLDGGIWVDAFACVNELIEVNPKDQELKDLRDRLIRPWNPPGVPPGDMDPYLVPLAIR